MFATFATIGGECRDLMSFLRFATVGGEANKFEVVRWFATLGSEFFGEQVWRLYKSQLLSKANPYLWIRSREWFATVGGEAKGVC